MRQGRQTATHIATHETTLPKDRSYPPKCKSTPVERRRLRDLRLSWVREAGEATVGRRLLRSEGHTFAVESS